MSSRLKGGKVRKYKAWKVKGLNLATSTSEVRNLKVEILTSAPGDLRTGPGPQCAHHTLTAKLSTPFQTDPNVHRAVARETTFPSTQGLPHRAPFLNGPLASLPPPHASGPLWTPGTPPQPGAALQCPWGSDAHYFWPQPQRQK